jgi:hypothetical protein
MSYIAGAILALLLLAGVVIVVLAFLDRLPFPKQPLEPTPLQREMAEFNRAMTDVQRTVGEAMLPAVLKMNEAINRMGAAFRKEREP